MEQTNGKRMTVFSKLTIRKAKQYFGFKSNTTDSIVDRFLSFCVTLLDDPDLAIDTISLRQIIGITIDQRKGEYFHIKYPEKDHEGHNEGTNRYQLRTQHKRFILEILEELMNEQHSIELLEHDGKTYVKKDLHIAGVKKINYEQARALSLDLHAAWKIQDPASVNRKWNLNIRVGQIEKLIADIFLLIQQFKNGEANYEYREDPCGRFFVKDRKKNFQNGYKVARHVLLGGMTNYDYDLSTAHFAIIRQKMIVDLGMKSFDEQYTAIADYIEKKSVIRPWLAKALNVDEELVKTVINSIGYGGVLHAPSMKSDTFAAIVKYVKEKHGSENWRDIATAILKDFKNNEIIQSLQDEVQKASKILIEHYLDGKDYLINDRGWIFDARNKKPAQILSNILMTIEGNILLKIIDKYGPNIVLLMHDGFITNKRIGTEELEAYIKREFNYDLKYSEEQL